MQQQHGSGKTAVLVERIIQKIIKDKIDIDKLLVVTFTNAAASEMRERVLEAIYKKLDEKPDDTNLQRQIVLLGKSNICTIHSFCLDVIKNNFFEVDLSANFRIGNEEEIELLKQEVLEDLFERLYEEEQENFIKLVNTYTDYRGDDKLKEIIFKVYNFIQSAPFPEEWLEEKIDKFKKSDDDNDFAKTSWGEVLIKNLQEELIYGVNSLKIVKEKVEKHVELEKYVSTLSGDISMLKELYDKCKKDWNSIYEFTSTMRFKAWPIDRKITMDLKDEAKDSRDIIKKKIMELINKVLIYDSSEAFEDIYEMYDVLKYLKEVILEFDTQFKNKKHERNIIDFNDIEHYALKILVAKNEDGEYVSTDAAKKYKQRFCEIAIDEYQDSNQVQEFILKSISNGNNIFMVGDVKQSIYKFRQACPELFLNKYDNYSLEGNDKGLKIKLFKNFRSRKNVLDITNTVFENIMSKELGSIDYTKEEYLNLGSDYEEYENGLGNSEIHLIDLEEEEYLENDDVEKAKEEISIEKEEIEASFVSEKIEELIKSKVQVKDKKLGKRDIQYRDIVILLRSTSNIAPIYEKELIKKEIPVFSDASSEYLDTMEIQTIMNLLKILDNPIDDISLVSVLRSKIGNFTDNEIIEIRYEDKTGDYYNSLISAKQNLEENLKEKIETFLAKLDEWRKESDTLSLAELIWKIYLDTGFYNYVGLMSNGSLRQANLKMLFERAREYEKTSFKGLFNFIRFIERVRVTNGDMSAAKIIGENENVVRIMSIHKSKGLEFPVVFISATSKQINMQDLKADILLHQDFGIGPEYINYEKRIEYPTSAKEAMKIIIKEETIAEEMRMLYVALTRAKEKLIITGTVKNYEKNIEKKKDDLKIYNSKTGKINPVLIKKYISYLDWILLVLLNSDISDIASLKTYKKSKILVNEEKVREIREFNFEKETDFEDFEKALNWKYPKLIATKLPIKSTVSKIKEMQADSVDFENLKSREIGIANIAPIFMQDEKENVISGSIKGTLMHLFLQRIDFKIDYNINKLDELRNELIAKKIITENESKTIDLNKVDNFLKSDLIKKTKTSKEIGKEKAFCIKMNAKEFFEDAENETILVQGIIDLYFVDANDEIVLIDYKTDYVKNEKELIDKYRVQLELYRKALEMGLGKKVVGMYIYSLYLNKEINIE